MGKIKTYELFAVRKFFNVERLMGIEPTYRAWEARILPMNYSRKIFRTLFIAHNVPKSQYKMKPTANKTGKNLSAFLITVCTAFAYSVM